jgi:hypothetical protein
MTFIEMMPVSSHYFLQGHSAIMQYLTETLIVSTPPAQIKSICWYLPGTLTGYLNTLLLPYLIQQVELTF